MLQGVPAPTSWLKRLVLGRPFRSDTLGETLLPKSLVVAGALMGDYIMPVAVSVAAGVDNIISAVPELNGYRIAIDIGFIALLMAMNLRGIRESGRTFAIPTYLFIAGVVLMIVLGLA